jgi:hypothetical protein
MEINSIKEGLFVGFIAMLWVFVVLTLIALVLKLFEFLFYRKKTLEIQPKIPIEKAGVSKNLLVAISTAILDYIYSPEEKKEEVSIRKKQFINESFKKLKIKRWKNG